MGPTPWPLGERKAIPSPCSHLSGSIPRLGKVIKEVRLKGTTGFRGGDPGWVNDFGPVIPTNGVIFEGHQRRQETAVSKPNYS